MLWWERIRDRSMTRRRSWVWRFWMRRDLRSWVGWSRERCVHSICYGTRSRSNLENSGADDWGGGDVHVAAGDEQGRGVGVLVFGGERDVCLGREWRGIGDLFFEGESVGRRSARGELWICDGFCGAGERNCAGDVFAFS